MESSVAASGNLVAVVGRLGSMLEAILVQSGLSGAILEAILPYLGPSWSDLGPSWTLQHFAGPHDTTRHHAAPRDTSATPRDPTRHHTTPLDITRHHATQRDTSRQHSTPCDTTRHRATPARHQRDTARRHATPRDTSEPPVASEVAGRNHDFPPPTPRAASHARHVTHDTNTKLETRFPRRGAAPASHPNL